LAAKFGVTAQTTPPEEFYGVISSFATLWDKTKKESEAKKAKAEKEAKRLVEEVRLTLLC